MKSLLFSLLLVASAVVSKSASFTLAWDPTFGASQYAVRLTLGTNITVVIATSTSYQFTNLLDGVAYTVNVTGQSPDGLSGPTSTNKVVLLPGQPNNLKVSQCLEKAPLLTDPWTLDTNALATVTSSNVLWQTFADTNVDQMFYRVRSEVRFVKR